MIGWNDMRGAQQWAPHVILAAAVACLCAGCPKADDEKDPADQEPSGRTTSLIAEPEAVSKPGKKISEKAAKSGERKPLKLSSNLMHTLLEKAAETGNRDAIRELAAEYARNPDPAERLDFVEGLFGIGREGILPLADFLADPDAEVASRATVMLESQIDMLEDPTLKTQLIGQVLMRLDDEDSVRVFCSKLETVPANYAVRKIVDIVRFEAVNPKAAEIAKEEYETITGEKFTDIKAANGWIFMSER